eukprot:221460-Pyramimonas_sp.AAC.1
MLLALISALVAWLVSTAISLYIKLVWCSVTACPKLSASVPLPYTKERSTSSASRPVPWARESLPARRASPSRTLG